MSNIYITAYSPFINSNLFNRYQNILDSKSSENFIRDTFEIDKEHFIQNIKEKFYDSKD